MAILHSLVCVALAFAALVAAAGEDHLVQLLGPQSVNLWRLNRNRGQSKLEAAQSYATEEAMQAPLSTHHFQARWFEQPLDHFSNDSRTWSQRYWINDRHYRPDSGKPVPVIVIDGGETSGEDRLPFLDTGIAEILANATGGVGVVLEHRYYGQSIPVTDLSTDSLRWLNNAQAAADSANFMANVKFSGIEEDLTAPHSPWIYYGGSYAGARAAHMRVLYPELVFGAIASSAVTHATIENWEYSDIIRNAADPKCIQHLESSVQTIDHILEYSNKSIKRRLKGLFGVADLEHDEDFASLIESPISGWQAKNWDPAVGSTSWEQFCEALDKPVLGHKDLVVLSGDETAVYDHITGTVSLADMDGIQLDLSLLNYARYIRENYVSQCPVDEGATIEQCFGTYDDSQLQGIGLDETWRLWVFQVCTEWGYFFNSPPEGHPRISSKLLTLDYASKTCRQAYPPGVHFVVPHLPNVTVVNALGDFGIEAERLALIDGEVDPWRPCTPHSDYARQREDTISKPFKLIPGGVHHYDENGLRRHADEPLHIRRIHQEIIDFVDAWLKDWKAPKANVTL